MSKKRANGEGNIRKRKNGRWEGRYTAGYRLLQKWKAQPQCGQYFGKKRIQSV